MTSRPAANPGIRPSLSLLAAVSLAFVFGAFTAVASPHESKRRAEILQAMESIMGPFPTASDRQAALEMKVESESDEGTYLRRGITYLSEPGGRVPAYLLVPKSVLASPVPAADHARLTPGEGTRPTGSKQAPAVLALHQTHPQGRRVVVGLGSSPDDEYGVELVKRGYVVLAPPYPLLSDYQPDVRGLGHISGTMKAIWDNVRGLDLLSSLPYVRTNGFAVIGHSLGGHNGLFTAAYDTRIKVVVTSCGFDSFRDYQDGNPDVWRPEKGWCQTRYMPRLAAYQGHLADIPFDFSDVLEAIAPRAVFVNAPLGDSNFRWKSVDRLVDGVRPVFAVLDPIPRTAALAAGDILVVRHPDSPHRFPPELRNEAYEFIDRVLADSQRGVRR